MSYIDSVYGLFPGQTLLAFSNKLIILRHRNLGRLLQLSLINPNQVISLITYTYGAQSFFARSAGTYCTALYKSHNLEFFVIKIPSGKLINVPLTASACIGRLSNRQHKKEVIGNAGRLRRLGNRPHVRGVAMNPVDHPHGGRTKTNQPEVSP